MSIPLLSCVLFIWSSLPAGIIGATRWEKEGKSVVVYFDSHEDGSAEDIAVQFNYLKNEIIETAAARSKPLLVLVENYMREPQYRDVVRRLELFAGYNTRFLQRFDELVGMTVPGRLEIKSIEARVVPFLTFPLFCEWQRIANGKSILIPDNLYQELNCLFATLTFGQVFALVNQMDTYVDTAPSVELRAIFEQQRDTLYEYVYNARQILLGGGFSEDDLSTKPIKKMVEEKTHDYEKAHAWQNLFIDFRGQDFWPIDFLWQLTNAHMLWEIIHAPGDVALFTGSYHAVVVETFLQELGYRCAGYARKIQVDHQRAVFLGQKPYKDVSLNLISCAAFDWLK